MSSANPQCPYTLLAVPRNATATEIKRQYRKLALKHHPDKGGDEATFKEISAAYEILSDEGRRAEYDHAMDAAEEATRARAAASGSGGGRRRRSRPSSSAGRQQHQQYEQQQEQDHAADRDPFNHPFFGRSSGGGGMHGQHFTDPFDLFERMFREEFGGGGSGGLGPTRHGSGRHGSASHAASRSSTSAGSRRRDPFGDPFFSSSGAVRGLGTRGGGVEGMMARMSRQMDAMSSVMDMRHHHHHHHHHGMRSSGGSRLSNNSGSSGGNFSSSFSTSASSFGGGGFGGSGQSVSTSTTTRIVNGVQETVTERTVVHPDGRVDRHVQRASSDIGGGSSRRGAIAGDRHRRYIDQGRG